MKRNANLIREILLSVEADKPAIESKLADQDTINYHLHTMIEAGLLNGQEINEGRWRVYGLTWEGHELIELIRDRWEDISRVLADSNCYNFEFIRQVARRLIE